MHNANIATSVAELLVNLLSKKYRFEHLFLSLHLKLIFLTGKGG